MTELTRKEKDDIRRRQEILDKALVIFASQGFHGTTMAQISQESQYPLGTIYKYFSSKKQIYHDLVVDKAQKLGQIFLSISRDTSLSGTEKLERSLAAIARFYRDNYEVMKIFIAERSNLDSVVVPRLNKKINRLQEKMVELFQEIFEKGVEDGEFKPYPPRAMAMLFSDIAHSTAFNLAGGLNGSSADEELTMIFDMFTRGIIKQ